LENSPSFGGEERNKSMDDGSKDFGIERD